MGGRKVNIVADTNILARAVLDDDTGQAGAARKLLGEAETVTVPFLAIYELVWLMSRSYRLKPKHVAVSIGLLLESQNVVCDRLAVEAGIAMMEAGGDFADGVMALQGRRLGGITFATFDKKTAALITASGRDSILVEVGG